MCVLLESHGFEVEEYASAHELLENVPPAEGRCLLLDLYMPDMDGAAVVQALKQQGSSLPVLMLTGRPESPLAKRALNAGARAVLSKPVEQDVLLEAIHAVFEPEFAAGDRASWGGGRDSAGRVGFRP